MFYDIKLAFHIHKILTVLGRHALIFDNPFHKCCLPIIQGPPIETYVMS